jgi:hypothetical protein
MAHKKTQSQIIGEQFHEAITEPAEYARKLISVPAYIKHKDTIALMVKKAEIREQKRFEQDSADEDENNLDDHFNWDGSL